MNIWIIFDNSNNQNYLKQINFIDNSLKKLNIDYKLIKNTDITQKYININKKPSKVFYYSTNLLEKIKLLENNNIKVINNYNNTSLVNNKISQLEILSKHNLTPKIYLNINEITKYPIILKYKNSILSNGVFIINNEDELLSKTSNYNKEDYILQEFFNYKPDLILKVFIYNNNIISSYKKEEINGFISSSTHQLTEYERNIALKAIKLLNLEYGSVDIIYKDVLKPYICEVNTVPNIINIYNITNINIINEIYKLNKS